MKLNRATFLPLAILSLGLLASAGNLSAESSDKAKSEQKKELPKSGVLSSTGDVGYSDGTVAGPWGDDSGSGSAPVSGSCSRNQAGDWTVKILNGSKDIYSIDLEVVQKDSDRKKVKSDHFSYTLRAGQSEQRNVYSASGGQLCEVRLANWKKKEVKKEEDKKDAMAATGIPPKK